MDAERKQRLITCGIVSGVFVALWLVCGLLRGTYLFGWAITNGKGLLLLGWGLALALGAFGQRLLAYFVAAGNAVGVFFGQYFGDFLVARKIAALNAQSDAADRYWAYYHHGAFIWVIVALVFFLVGLGLTLWRKYKPRPTQTK